MSKKIKFLVLLLSSCTQTGQGNSVNKEFYLLTNVIDSVQPQKEASPKVTTLNSATIIEVDLSVCCIKNDQNTGIYGVIEINQAIEGIPISACFDSELEVLDLCEIQTLSKNYNKNTIKINNSQLSLGNDLNGIDLSLFIPDRLFVITKKEVKYVVFEMYNFSYTTVGGGYTYVLIGLNKSNEINKHKIFEYKKEPIELGILNKEIDQLF